MEIKDILKNRRLELGLTLKDIADQVGVTVPTISRWESGDIANMKRDKIVSYAKALNVSPTVIMGWEAPEQQNPEAIQTLDYLFDMLSAKGQESLISYMKFLETDPSNLDPDKFIKEIFLDGLSVEARTKRKALAKELRIQNNLEKSINRHK